MAATYTPMRDEYWDGSSLDAAGRFKLLARLSVLGLLFVSLAIHSGRDSWKAALRATAPWWIFVAWAVISTLWSARPSVSLGQSISLFILVMLALRTALSCTSEAVVSRLLCGVSLLLLGISSALVALRLAAPSSMSLTRDTDGLLHSTNSSAAAGLGLLILIAGLTVGRWAWSSRLILPGLAAHGAALILANNRVSMATTFAALAALLLASGRRGWRELTWAAGCAVATLYMAVDPSMSLLRDLAGAAAQYTSRGQSAEEIAALSGRAEMWAAIWESYLQSPWIGHGYFVTSAEGELYVWYTWGNWTAHNFWLQILVTTGVVGAALVVWAYGGLVLRMSRRLIAGGATARIAAIVTAALAWHFCWGLANESFSGPVMPESVVFFVMVGIGTALVIHPPDEEPSGGLR